MTLRLCSFCGSVPGDHRGFRASICSDCVRGLAAKLGWTMLPPGPAVRSTHEALEKLLADFAPEVQLRGVNLVHQVHLLLQQPLPPDGLAWLTEAVTGLMGGPEAVVVKATPELSSTRSVYWVEGAAAPLYLALPGRAAASVALADHVEALRSFGRLLPAGTSVRHLTDGACALAAGDLDVAERHLGQVEPAQALGPEAALADAVRLALRGDWVPAMEALARLEGRSTGLVQHLARLNRARLLLLHRRVRPAEDLLERVPLPEARELREGLTRQVARRAECAQGLQHVALALEEFRRASGALPDGLEELKPHFLTVLPTCGTAPFHYRKGRGGFALQCASRLHAELPRGWPRWTLAGVVSRPAEFPDSAVDAARRRSGPLESLAPRRPTRGFWVAACREGAGDLPGAALALRDVPGREAAFYRALLAERRGLSEEALADLREAVRAGGIVLRHRDLLEAWLDPALEGSGATPMMAGIFLALLRAQRTDLVERLLPRVPDTGPAQRLRYLCEVARLLPKMDRPLIQGLEAAFDHRTPEAALCLELAVVEGDGAVPALLKLARQYRLAGRLDAARSALDEAERLAPGHAPATTLERALIGFAAGAGAEALLEVAAQSPGDADVQVEVLARLVEAGRPVDLGLLSSLGDPRAELLLTYLVERPEARTRCEALVARHPQFAAAWLRLAVLQDSPDLTLEVCQKGLQERPAHVPLLALVARLCPDARLLERLRHLRPDLRDPMGILDGLLVDGPSPDWGLPKRAVPGADMG